MNLDYQPPRCTCNQKVIEKAHTCWVSGCATEWTVSIRDPAEIKKKCKQHGVLFVCGSPERYIVCPSCSAKGYSARGGIGNGIVYVNFNGKCVEEINEK